jgi:hypothetical protein
MLNQARIMLKCVKNTSVFDQKAVNLQSNFLPFSAGCSEASLVAAIENLGPCLKLSCFMQKIRNTYRVEKLMVQGVASVCLLSCSCSQKFLA